MSDPEKAVEICPAFFMDDDRIIEVAFGEWVDNGDGAWSLAKPFTLHLDRYVDRIIFELPHGCFAKYVTLEPGPVHLMLDKSSDLQRCTRHDFAVTPNSGDITVQRYEDEDGPLLLSPEFDD